MQFDFFFTESSASLHILEDKKSLLAKIFSSERSKTFNDLSKSDQGIALAIADLRYCAEQTDTHIEFLENEIHFHIKPSCDNCAFSKKPGLPSVTHLTLETDIQGPWEQRFSIKIFVDIARTKQNRKDRCSTANL